MKINDKGISKEVDRDIMKLIRKRGYPSSLSDIARKYGITPQAVSLRYIKLKNK